MCVCGGGGGGGGGGAAKMNCVPKNYPALQAYKRAPAK